MTQLSEVENVMNLFFLYFHRILVYYITLHNIILYYIIDLYLFIHWIRRLGCAI